MRRRPLEPEPDNAGGGKKMRNNTVVRASETRILAEMSVLVATAAVLHYLSRLFLPFLHLPQGGSITAASMVPIFLFALRRGLRWGVEAGVVFGLVDLAITETFVATNPIQLLLDYPLAFGALGLAGAFKKQPLVGVGVGITGRFVFHFISGIVFFWMYAWAGWNPVLYSAAYNASYLVPEFAISAIIIYVLDSRKLIDIYI
jgi:thiamine transporter